MNCKKKLLVYAHYFYPDVASTGQILTELCEGLSEYFDITVICVVPSYSGKIEDKYKSKKIYYETMDDIKIIRVRVSEFEKDKKLSRIKNLLGYFFNSLIATASLGKQDYIFTISQPPILGGVLGAIGKVLKGGKLIYNIQDFNPEQIMAVNYSKNKIVLKLAMFIDKFSCRVSDKIIVVGRDMQETLKQRFKDSKKIPSNVFINNWIDEKAIYPLEKDNYGVLSFKEKYKLNNKFVIMYSGNIGLYYDLENLIKILGIFKHREDVVFAFVGDGSVKNKIEKYSKENNLENVKFIPYQKKEDLIYSLNAADVHLVVNSKGIKGVSVPSKLYGVMAVGKSVLGILDSGSEARMIIEECGCGICVDPGNYEGIEKTMTYILNSKHKFIDLGYNGRKYLEENITKERAIKKYVDNILQKKEIEKNNSLMEILEVSSDSE